MPKKKVKNVYVKPQTNKDVIQIDLKKDLDDDKKIKPEKVFEGFKQSKKKTNTKNKSKY
jgi:hypothetical protein